MAQYQVYGIGNALVDTEVEVSDAFLAQRSIEKGVMTLVDASRQQELVDSLQQQEFAVKHASGGSAANTIIGAQYFGAKTYYGFRVADDTDGRFYVEDLNAAGVAHNGNTVGNAPLPTGKCLVMVTADAERTMNTCLSISEQVSVEDLNPEAIASSEYVYLEGYLVTSDTGRAAAIKMRELAEAAGVKTALTFSDPAMVEFFKDGLNDMLGDGVDLLFCNEQEAINWAEASDVMAAAEKIKTVAKAFVITLGANGALVFDGDHFIEVAPHKTTAVDSNGAGDMFAGAFLYAITSGRSFSEAGRFASMSAAKVVSQFGPRLQAEQYHELHQQCFGALKEEL